MVWVRKKSFLYRFVPLLVLLVMLFGLVATPVYATEPSEEEGVGTSLYSVSTALTAFASNVVGANTNDKHVDDGSGADIAHKVVELGASGVDVGDAGAIIGYGDKTKGFIGYIAANETRSVTTSSYGAYLSIGDGNKAYTYARYGRLLNELGIDETGNPAKANGSRAIGGRVLQGFYVCSTFIPTAFDVSFDILRLLNPFRFLVNQKAVENTVTDWNTTGGTNVGVVSEPFDDGTGNVTITEETVTPEAIDGIDEYSNTGIESGLSRISEITTMIYTRMRAIGTIIVIPLLLVFLISGIVLRSAFGARGGMGHWPRIRVFLIRFVFIVVGIPLIGLMYTAALDEVQDNALENSPSSRIIASTFVDFENWVKVARLSPPQGVTLVSDGIPGSESQGRASNDSWRTIRQSIYTINKELNLYNLPDDSGLGIGVKGTLNAGMWDTDGKFTEELTSDSATRKAMFERMNSLLSTYANGSFYTASAWESDVNSTLTANYRSDLGSSPTTDAASPNKETIYQMYFDTDEVDDWMNRSAGDNSYVFMGVNNPSADSPDECKWSGKEWNIFSNGSNFVNSLPSGADSNIVYQHVSGSSWTNGIDPKYSGGLSTVSTYNYLSSAFNASNIAVYSAANTTSEYTRLQHYSVNSAGSGLLGFLFLLNCCVVLGVFVLLGAYYCIGMLIHNIKSGISLIMTIPAAMVGVVKSIVQVVVYVINMILEILGTVFLYQFVMELVVIFASIVETPIQDAIDNITAMSLVGGLFASNESLNFVNVLGNNQLAFGFSLFAVIIGLLCIGTFVVRSHRAVLVVWAYGRLRFLRAMTLPEFVPMFDKWVQSQPLYVWDAIADDMNNMNVVVTNVVKSLDVPMVSAERGVGV